MPVRRPLDILKLAHQFWPYPVTILHLFRSKTQSPATGFLFRQVHEWTFWALQAAKTFVQALPQQRGKAIASSSGIMKLAVSVVPKNDCIEVLWTGGIPAEHEFLPLVDAHLTPGAGAPTGFIQAVQVFRDYPFETLSAHSTNYVRETGAQLRTLTDRFFELSNNVTPQQIASLRGAA